LTNGFRRKRKRERGERERERERGEREKERVREKLKRGGSSFDYFNKTKAFGITV
jgi:hypothetical protein